MVINLYMSVGRIALHDITTLIIVANKTFMHIFESVIGY